MALGRPCPGQRINTGGTEEGATSGRDIGGGERAEGGGETGGGAEGTAGAGMGVPR